MLNKHKTIEKNSVLFLILIIVVISIGGIIEIIPLFRMETVIEKVKGMRPYTPLELIGQNVYISEGCSNCHSQQIRPLRDEVERYGHYSLAAESMYDHPFLWGSKRTGPDLARVGGKYSDAWHRQHLQNPRSVVPESIMPPYGHLVKKDISGDLKSINEHLKTLRILGVPYTDDMVKNAENDAMAQSGNEDLMEGLRSRYGEKTLARDFDGNPNKITELDALISYLQVLGTMVDFKTLNKNIKPATKVKP